MRFVRVDGQSQWLPGPDADTADYTLAGGIDPVDDGDATRGLALTGWLGGDPTDLQGVSLFLGGPGVSGVLLAQGRLVDGAATMRFAFDVPPNQIPAGTSALTVAARTVDHGTWLATLQVVNPVLGDVATVVRPTPVRGAGRADRSDSPDSRSVHRSRVTRSVARSSWRAARLRPD